MTVVLLSTLLYGACQSEPPPDDPVEAEESAAPEFEDPIAFVGHGAMFDKHGAEMPATPELMEAVQEAYLHALLEGASEEQRAAFEAKRQRVLGGVEWDARSQIHARSALIDGLIEEVKPPDAARLAGHNSVLRTAATGSDFAGDAAAFEVPGELRTLLLEEGLAPDGADASATTTAATGNGGAAYIAECSAAGVPIPPTWGTSAWVSRGVLANEFISSGYEAEVFTYQSSSPQGVCFALPRSSGNTIKLLGIICLGKASSNACFWDNQVPGDSRDIQKGEVVPLSMFFGGADLQKSVGGECTDCHAGENPYIIHPGTVLGLPNLNGLPMRGDSWYKPLVAADWSQNPGPTNLLAGVPSEGKCTSCHTQTGGGGRFPSVSTALPLYCSIVLPTAFDRTMPPGAPESAAYKAHFDALKAACDLPPLISPRAPAHATVSAAVRSSDKLDVFVTDVNGKIYTAAWEPSFINGWQGWWNVAGGNAAPGAPVHAVSRANDKLDVFVVPGDQRVYTAAWEPSFTDGWHGWWWVAGGIVAPSSHVTAVRRAQNKIDVFAVGPDGGVYTASWQSGQTWVGWSRIGNIVVPQGAAVHGVSRRTNHIDIFATDVNGLVWTAARDSSGWHGWWQIQGGVAHPGAPVTAVSRNVDALDVFVVGTDGRVWTAAWKPGFESWRGWWPVGAEKFPQGAPIHVVSRRPDNMDIFGVNVHGDTVTAAWEPSFGETWHGWWSIQGGKAAPGAPLTAVSRSENKLDVFVVGLDKRIWTASWQPGFETWAGWWPIGQ